MPDAGKSADRGLAPGRFTLTARILVVNILPLALLGGGLFGLALWRRRRKAA